MKLFWKSFGPIPTMASLHADNCAHLKFAGKGTGITVIPVSGEDDPIVKDLKERDYPVRLAPCLKKTGGKPMKEFQQVVRAFAVNEQKKQTLKEGSADIDTALDRLRTSAKDLADEMGDLHVINPGMPSTTDNPQMLKDIKTVVNDIEHILMKWTRIRSRWGL